ncbi:MAG: methyltransferase domain-containing protein [Gemmatimonadales bacterium]|jgi:SAM-dependent methyltransferase
MTLEFVKRTYEKLGRDDPLYAVLSDKRLRHNRWDPAEFFRTGEREIQGVLGYVEDLGLTLERRRALDFGCAVGRLSQALAEHFDRVVGVDIAESMIEKAREYNRYGDRVDYRVNSVDNLGILKADSFDFVYTNITLQHIPPAAAENYIREFFRVLRPDGIAIFQVPSGTPYQPRSLRARLYTLRRRYVRRVWKLVRRMPPVEIHYVPRARVERIVEQSGGRLVDVLDVGKRHRRGKNFRYCATKSGLAT